MPPQMKKAHDVFHVSKLKPYMRSLNTSGPLSVVIGADGNVEQEVVAVLDKKRENRRVFYLVQFEGDPKEEAIWTHKSELKNCMDLVRKYELSTRTSNSR